MHISIFQAQFYPNASLSLEICGKTENGGNCKLFVDWDKLVNLSKFSL